MNGDARSSQNFYKNILDSLGDGVVTLDSRHRVMAFNPAMESISGLSAGKVLHKDLFSVLPELTFLKEKVDHVFRTGETFSDFDASFRPNKNREIQVSLVISPMMDDDGKCEGVIVVMGDRSNVQDIQRAERYAELADDFRVILSSMVHEIKNPMGGIKGAAQILQEELVDNQLREFPRVIINEVDRVTGLLDGMSKLFQPLELELEKVNIHQVLDDVIMLETTRAEGKGVNLLQNYDPSLPEIVADRGKLVQLFINILRNGLEAMPEGGTLSLNTKLSDQIKITRSRGRQSTSRLLLVTVEDTGVGIPEEELDKVFTPYFTTKEEGSGLGLAVSMNIVEQHGGRIQIDSRPGRGTAVKVYLPLGG
jgi:two-component system nitrogen regulation sensor histidine kinase GlnL